MPKKAPNTIIRQRWQQGRSVVEREEHRKLTQREFLDVAFGNNPRTGKPYNTRTLRKWLNNETDATRAYEHSVRDTYSFSQHVTIGDDEFAPTLTKPSNVPGVDLFTSAGRKRIRRATKERLEQRLDALNVRGKPRGQKPPDGIGGSPDRLRTTRGLKLAKARVVKQGRLGITITRKKSIPLRYTSAA